MCAGVGEKGGGGILGELLSGVGAMIGQNIGVNIEVNVGVNVGGEYCKLESENKKMNTR